MRLIRVTYRATFQQPLQGPLNPMGLKIHGPLFIEVYQAGPEKWMARTIEHKDPWPIQHGSTADQMKANVVASFEAQVTDWEIWGRPDPMERVRMLQPEEVEIRENGQVYFKDPPQETKR
jgi:hypothetical protein